MRLSLVSLGAVCAVAVCAAGGIRPSYAPFPQAIVDTVKADPPAVIQEAVTRLQAEAMQPQWTSPKEGYLETQWFDVVSRASGVADRGNPDRVILIGLFVDSIGPSLSKVVAECVYKRTTDPSVQPRDQEMMVPPGHAGDRILRQVLAGLHERFGR